MRILVAMVMLSVSMVCLADEGTMISVDVLRDPTRAATLVSNTQQDAYKKVLAAYAKEEAAHSNDEALVLARCKFIDGFVESEDLSWSDEAEADKAACQETLGNRFRDHAESNLYLAQQHYGDDAVCFIRKLLPASQHWTPQQQSRLHVLLARAYTSKKQTALAGQEALASVQLDPASSELVTALRYLCNTGRRSQAEAMLTSTPVSKEPWQAMQRVRFAADNLSAPVAMGELARSKGTSVQNDPWLAAHVYMRAGMPSKAAEALSKIKTPSTYQTMEQFKLRAEIAYGQGNGEAESAAIRDWFAKVGFSGPLLFAYGSLLAHNPMQLFSPPLMPLALSMLAMLIVMALLPGLIAFPAHYRGTVRARLSKLTPPIFESIGLRHMWWGLGTLLVMSVLVPMLGAGSAVQVVSAGKALSISEQTALATAQLATVAIASLLLLPVVRRLSWRQWLGDRGLKAALFSVPVFIVLKIVIFWLIAYVAHAHGSIQTTTHDREVAGIAEGATHIGGAALALLLVAVLVPILEEVVFRGLILGGLSRHLSFAWANTWQACLFTVLHFDFTRAAFYFSLGLLAGWLVRRTRGLGASIALHVLNNGIATVWLLSAG